MRMKNQVGVAALLRSPESWNKQRRPALHRSAATTLLILLTSTGFPATAITTSTVDGGGQHATSANYAMDASIGGIDGISSASADTAKNGYIGQLTEVVSLVVTALPDPVSEFSNAQLSAKATLDDATVVPLTGNLVMWSSSGVPYPLKSISGGGVVIATNVYQDTATTVNGYYLGGASNVTLLVLDTFPDDYGIYANDGIPDSWQAQYFGLNNSNAFPNIDVDGTGQNNLFKYIAGLDPTNPASIFLLKIAAVSGQPSQKNLIYNPIATGRTYTVESRTNLVSGSYAALGSFTGPQTNVTTATVTDLNATSTTKFYHVRISFP